ncbi:hypothetical protein VCHENC02_1855B, partial [Vibrio harveyi]
QYG